ncbi:FtsB family cell division protein [Ureibacillus chungkukjangi]|uniref:Cell division protein DivIC n=1 Tax=Ureibacillus chungkukjangi TaxID=1202712 RepID=A0A318TYC7_9BACL|nr:septum formation initiator family protein [Ureibacillus chungkukjangi]MCM3389816.1 septum formation initiator family protein [Ureibacillus chungkukjangi]PYF04649.1 cell division protein DivIC [Ureibacillus chungkukjangi]
MSKRQKRQSNNVRTLENDYVRSTDNKTQYSKKQKVRIRRRLLAFGLLASVILVLLISTTFSQNKRLAEKQQQKEVVMTKLDEAKEQQDMLSLQIAKLEDDDYIAKLARKEYFLSDDGEIIFTIPGEEEKTEKSDKNSN